MINDELDKLIAHHEWEAGLWMVGSPGHKMHLEWAAGLRTLQTESVLPRDPMLERINKLLKTLEWRRYVTSAEGIVVSTCPSCHRPCYGHFEQAGGHAPDCELKACLDEMDTRAKREEAKADD